MTKTCLTVYLLVTLLLGWGSRGKGEQLPVIVDKPVASSTQNPNRPQLTSGGYLTGRNYSYAVYNSYNRLAHSPIEHLQNELDRRKIPISDVFLISHGWNYTMEESAALYENYRLSLEPVIAKIKQFDRHFEPYFIFITWDSVTRPLTNGLRSVSAFEMPNTLIRGISMVDAVAFHTFSNWGETLDAFKIALGKPKRRNYDPQSYPIPFTQATLHHSEYSRSITGAKAKVVHRAFKGYKIPVSALIDQLIRMKYSTGGNTNGRFAIHTIGHSYGAKLISLASLDACARINLAFRNDRDNRKNSYIDSMILINPAMKVSEMYQPVELPSTDNIVVKTASKLLSGEPEDDKHFNAVSETIRRKAIIYSKHDSANGWVFSLSQFVLNYDAIAERSTGLDIGRSSIGIVKYFMGILMSLSQSAAADVGALFYEPLRAMRRTLDPDNAHRFFPNLLSIPFSPLVGQQAIGNKGVSRVRPTSRFSLNNRWFDSEAAEFLTVGSEHHDAQTFKSLTHEPGTTRLFTSKSYNTFDASLVYNGIIGNSPGKLKTAWGTLANQLLIGKAHGDVRSYGMVDGITKRERTFTFIYNFTRARQ